MIKTKRKDKKTRYGVLWQIAEYISPTQEKLTATFAILSLFSKFGDIPLVSLSLIYIQLAQKRTTKYLIGTASVVYFASTFLHTAEYVPYVSFVLVYLIADFLLDRDVSKAVWPAVITFAAVKAYLLSFGYESFYWIVFVAEIMAVVVLPRTAKSGFEILENNGTLTDFVQVFDVLSAFMVAALALDGIVLNGLRLSVTFLLAAAFFYGIKNNVALSLAAAGAMVLSLCGERYFIYLFAGYSVIYFMGSYLLPKGWQGYAVLLGCAVAVCLVLIPQFNSIVIVTTTCLAMAGCFAAVKNTSVQPLYAQGENIIAGEKEYLDLLGKIQKLNRCFNFLGHTVIDISQLIAKDFVPDQAEDIAAKEVCRRCKNNHICWQENFSHTQSQFSQYADSLSKGKEAQFDSLFLSRCDKSDRLAAALSSANSFAATQRLLASASQHNQKILQSQFMSMAEILRQIAARTGRSGTVNTALTASMDLFLRNMGKKINHCICYQDTNKCIINTRDGFSPQEIYRIKSKLELLYSTRFAMPVTEQEPDSVMYTFCQSPVYRCEYSIKNTSRNINCGDYCEYFETEDTAFVVLADGMGTGGFAAAESRTAVEMLKSLLCASVNPLQAVEIVNIAVNLKGTGQSCVAIDILAVDLYSGSCSIFKAGGAHSVLIKADRAKTVYKDSLPVGILKETKTAQLDFELESGDSVILLSDGVETDENLLDRLFILNRFDNVENMARCAAEKGSGSDDATAAAIKLLRT